MDFNRQAKILGKELKAEGIEVKHKKLLEIVAKSNGYKSWEDANRKDETYSFDVSFSIDSMFRLHVDAKSAQEAYEKTQSLIFTGLDFKAYLDDGHGFVKETEDVVIDLTDLQAEEIHCSKVLIN